MPRKPSSPAAGPGHNSLDSAKLRSLVERIEVVFERIALAEDLRGLYQEARLAAALR